MYFSVKLNSVEDAIRLVNKLERYECEADAWVGSRVIDARSLLGLLGFGLGKEIKIAIYKTPNIPLDLLRL